MKRKSFVILFLFCTHYYHAQFSALLNERLDSVINTPNPGHKVKYIYMVGQQVIADSMTIKKVQANKKDSTILITFSDRTQKRIRTNEFWGVITDYGEHRRFYHGITFPVWKANAPYFYRITKGGSDRYYFSETLTGGIYPLSMVSINEHVLDPFVKKDLETYVKESLPKNTYDNEKGDDGEFLSLMINGSVNLTLFLFNALVECIK